MCIYGLDADLIMLSLMNRNYDKIILIRDNSFNNTLSENKKVIDYLDIKNLRRYICNDLTNLLVEYKHINKNNIDLENLLYDYIIICFLLGNDFLDHAPSLSIKKNGIDTIMKAYVNSWKGFHLINKKDIFDNIRWKNSINLLYLKDIMYNLKNHESYFFKNFKQDQLAISETKIYEQLQLQESVYFYKDDFINFKQEDYKSRYYTFYGIKTSELNKACLNYIEGLYWIFGYYNNHIHQNWIWYYKYHNTPFCSDIFEFLRTTPFDFIYKYLENSMYLNKSDSFTEMKQLYMVLPKASLYSILYELNATSDLDQIKYTLFHYDKYYPDKLYVDLINKRYLWQSKIFFDNIDESILDNFIF